MILARTGYPDTTIQNGDMEMALGRSNLPDQGQRPGPHTSTQLTGLADQPDNRIHDHTFKRDHDADRRAAIEAQIAAYEAEGRDTTHLKKILGRKNAKSEGYEERLARVNVEQPQTPDDVPPNVVVSPTPETVPEPEDGSAPDKRDQDQTPKEGDPGNGATDPGPEAPKRKADRLPDQVATAPPAHASSVPVQEPRQAPAPRPTPATAARRAPAKRVPAKKVAAKRDTTG